jgi:vacuolar-type H+-ATPase subunit H
VDSKLVLMVRDLESEAEQTLREAKEQAAGIGRDSERERARLAEKTQANTKREAAELIKSSRQKTQEDLERNRAEEKVSLDALLHRAETRLEKASRLILDRLGKL